MSPIFSASIPKQHFNEEQWPVDVIEISVPLKLVKRDVNIVSPVFDGFSNKIDDIENIDKNEDELELAETHVFRPVIRYRIRKSSELVHNDPIKYFAQYLSQ